jgi:cytoskeletal protein CcmA (bactofilin family)
LIGSTNRQPATWPPADEWPPEAIGHPTAAQLEGEATAMVSHPGGEQSGRAPAAGESVVGRNLRIKGECEVAGRLLVEGHITGDVRASSVEVAAGGRVDGSISGPDGKSPAGSVVVGGRVGGGVRGARVDVQAQGEVMDGVVSTDSVVSGRVNGGLAASGRFTLSGTGFVEGDVRTRRLVVEEGGQVNGSIRMDEVVD